MPTLPSLDLASLPKLSPADLTLLWVNDWYDGPLEAVVDLGGRRCLMVLASGAGGEDAPFRWVVFELTPEQVAEEERWHALFSEHVGDHWCFHDGAIPHAPSREPPSRDAFFDALSARTPPILAREKARGWTDEMPKR